MTPEQRSKLRHERALAHPKRHKFNKTAIRVKPMKSCLLEIKEPKGMVDALHNVAYSLQRLAISTQGLSKTVDKIAKFFARFQYQQNRKRRLRVPAKRGRVRA